MVCFSFVRRKEKEGHGIKPWPFALDYSRPSQQYVHSLSRSI